MKAKHSFVGCLRSDRQLVVYVLWWFRGWLVGLSFSPGPFGWRLLLLRRCGNYLFGEQPLLESRQLGGCCRFFGEPLLESRLVPWLVGCRGRQFGGCCCFGGMVSMASGAARFISSFVSLPPEASRGDAVHSLGKRCALSSGHPHVASPTHGAGREGGEQQSADCRL